MGAYVFFIACMAIWLAFGWALLARPAALDRTWTRVRRLPLVAKPVVWITFLPWLSGLAVWESNWRSPRARLIAVALLATAFTLFWASTTFAGGGSK